MNNDLIDLRTIYPESREWLVKKLELNSDVGDNKLDNVISGNLQIDHDKIIEAILNDDPDALRSIYLSLKNEQGEVTNMAWFWYLCSYNNNMIITEAEANQAAEEIKIAMDRLIYRYNCINRWINLSSNFLEKKNKIIKSSNDMYAKVWCFWFKYFAIPSTIFMLNEMLLGFGGTFMSLFSIIGMAFYLIAIPSEHFLHKSQTKKEQSEYYHKEKNMFAEDTIKYGDLEIRALHTYQALIN